MTDDRWSPSPEGQLEFADYLISYCDGMFASYPDARVSLANLHQRATQFREIVSGVSSISIGDFAVELQSEYEAEGTVFFELYNYVRGLTSGR